MIKATAYYRRRANRRMVQDLPEDLARMEAEAPLLVMGKVREVVVRDQVHEAGKAPPARRARFGVPAAPHTSRPRSAAGEQSLHFAINDKPGRSARRFDTYLTERKGEEEQTADIASEPAEAERSASILDRYALDHGGVDGEAPAVVTTLDPDPAIRRPQLDRIEAHELAKRRNADVGVARVNIRYDLAPELLLGVARRNDCPAGLREVILAERDRVVEGRPLARRRAQDGVPWIDPAAPAAMAMIANQPGFDAWRRRKRQPAKLSLGRGTRPTLSGEFEFPVDLDRAARHRVMLGLNAFVQRQLPPNAGRAVVPFVGVEHLPDALNDRRNPHGHFIIGKSAVEIGDQGELMIAPTTVPALTAITVVKRLRGEVASLVNDELDRCGADYRVSPETFAQMGIDASAQTKLHRERTVLERAGVATDAGIGNAEEGWRRRLQLAQDRHDEGLSLVVQRHRVLAEDIAREDDDARQRRLEEERTRVEANQRRALLLRHEAEEIGILCAMATSRAALTDDFAPGYAADAGKRANGGYLSSLWSARADEASAHLAALDIELVDERAGIAEREGLAARLETQSAAGLQAIAAALARRQPTADRAAPTHAPSAHRAVEIIAKAPLMVSRQGDRYVVRDVDDPDGLVRGVSLSGVSRRLEGIHHAQQNELRQIGAYVGRHGSGGLDEDALAEADGWVRRTVGKWRHTPAMERVAADWHRRRLVRNPAYRRMMEEHAAAADEWSGDLRQGLPDRLPTIGALSAEQLRGQGIILAPAPSPDVEPAVAEPAPLPAAPRRPSPARAAPVPVAPVTAWSDPARQQLKQRLRESARWRRDRDRHGMQEQLDRALARRAGDATRLTPHAARLLGRLADGFDPGRHKAPPWPQGRSLNQMDAVEIGVLSHQPLFAAQVGEAKRHDPALMTLVAKALRDAPPDKLGLVALVNDQVRDDPTDRPAGALLRSPYQLAMTAFPRFEASELSLSRHRGLTGVHDRRVVEAMQRNVVGLLYPEVQARLEAQRRMHLEEELAFLNDVASGRLRIETEIKDDRWGGGLSAYVWRRGETPEQQRVGKRLLGDADFYLACRAAQEGHVVPLRHPDAATRALLKAHEEKAGDAVIGLLRQRVPAPGGDVAAAACPADAALIARLLAPAPVVPPVPVQRRRRRGAPPLSPGRTLR